MGNQAGSQADSQAVDDSPPDATGRGHPALLLSDEALDEIASILLDAPPPLAAHDLMAFALVTRTWLSSARRALYRSPFDIAKFTSWRRGHALLTTLRLRPHLALHVRSLKDVVTRASLLGPIVCSHVTRSQSPHDDDRGVQVWNWTRQLLGACVNLRVAAVALDSLSHARKIIETLEGRSESLTTLIVDSLSLFPVERPAMRLWAGEVAARRLLPNLETLVIRGLEWTPETVLDEDGNVVERPSAAKSLFLPFPVRSLILEDQAIPLDDLLSLIPSASTLTSFSLSTTTSLPSSSIDTIGALLAPHLTSFALHSPPYRVAYTRLSRYGRHHRGATVPPTFFTNPFPKLRTLKLQSMRDMTVENLSAVLASAPRLEYLDLRMSIWDFDGLGADLLERQLDVALCAWERDVDVATDWGIGAGERRCHLGILPVMARHGLPRLAATMVGMGIQLRWEGYGILMEDDEDW